MLLVLGHDENMFGLGPLSTDLSCISVTIPLINVTIGSKSRFNYPRWYCAIANIRRAQAFVYTYAIDVFFGVMLNALVLGNKYPAVIIKARR